MLFYFGPSLGRPSVSITLLLLSLAFLSLKASTADSRQPNPPSRRLASPHPDQSDSAEQLDVGVGQPESSTDPFKPEAL